MRLKFAGLALFAAIVGAFGWHVWLRGEAIEVVRKVPSVWAVHSLMPVSVSIHPLTNEVRLSLDIAWASEPEGLLAKLGQRATGAAVETLWPPQVDQALADFARERWDLYALAQPYRTVVVEPGTPR